MCAKSLLGLRLQGLEMDYGEPWWRQGGGLPAVGRMTKVPCTPAPSPESPPLPTGPQLLRATQVPTCEVVGDPAVPTVAAVLEAAVPRSQDVQVLLPQQGKAPAWKRSSCETGTELGALREPDCLPATPHCSALGLPCTLPRNGRAWAPPPAWRNQMVLLLMQLQQRLI